MYYFKITIRVKEHNIIYLSTVKYKLIFFIETDDFIKIKALYICKHRCEENRIRKIDELDFGRHALTVFRCPDRLPLP